MSRTIYVERKFVTLHQKNPGYSFNGPYVLVDGVPTIRKYDLTTGYGDPGENPIAETFDYPEFTVGTITFTRPADYGTTMTYEREGPNGGTATGTAQKWQLVSVPDNFKIPLENYQNPFPPLMQAISDDLIDAVLKYAELRGVPGAHTLGLISLGTGLYEAIGTHLTTQFDLLNQASAGTITLGQLQARSAEATDILGLDLANTAGVPAVVTEGVKVAAAGHGLNFATGLVETAAATGPALQTFPSLKDARVVAGAANDRAIDFIGNDAFVLGDGDDRIYAGKGNDLYSGGEGLDVLDYSGARSGIKANLKGNVVVDGYGGTDRVVGFELVVGSKYRDVMVGDAFANLFLGRAGNDVLTGGAGKDVFIFDTKPNKKTNLDRITDYNVKADTFYVDNKYFPKVGKDGPLKAAAFWKGDKAHDASDRLIYNPKTGALFYDPDGTGAKAQVQIAILTKKLKLTHDDFIVI